MKILITIPHYYEEANGRHGSLGGSQNARIEALSKCLFNLYSLFSPSQYVLNIKDKKATSANQDSTQSIDVVICTANGNHLLDKAIIPSNFYKHKKCKLKEPKNLGFECHKVLKENLGKYDYYCFMEDDLMINDVQFFHKIQWFNSVTDTNCVLQPNRYEVSTSDRVLKSYIDGDINPKATANYQDITESSTIATKVLGQKTIFKRPLNPHSGCFFLTQEQMQHWANQQYFLDMDTSFVSPLESAATLGLMKTFKVYKPVIENANFLEIQHHGNAFLSLIGDKVELVK